MRKQFMSTKEFLLWLPARDRNVMVIDEDGQGGLSVIYEDEKEPWIKIEELLPEPGINVLVARPNQYSKKVDVLIAQLFDSGEAGRSYGRFGEGRWLYGKYWALPAVVPLKHVTHWMPSPVTPKWEAIFTDVKF